jgi:hypothetical protein
MCLFLVVVLQQVAGCCKGEAEKGKSEKSSIKMGLKRVSEAHKLVAGAGFEPATFRL